MKKFIIICISFVSLLGVAIFLGINNKSQQDNTYLRVHIRANSNNQVDQQIKMVVKKSVVDYLTPLIAEGSTFEQVYTILDQNLKNIEQVCDKVLKANGHSYTSTAYLNQEYFPTRSYGEYTLDNGFYDALIIELGSGTGDNWWCVVYPPLCFIGAEGTGTQAIEYKSKLLEIIEQFFS